MSWTECQGTPKADPSSVSAELAPPADASGDTDNGSIVSWTDSEAIPSSVVPWTPSDKGSIVSWTASEATPKAILPVPLTPSGDSIVSWTESEKTPNVLSPSSVMEWRPPVQDCNGTSRQAVISSVACNELEDHPVACKTPSRNQRVPLPSKSLRQQTPATSSMKKKIQFSSVDIVPAKKGK